MNSQGLIAGIMLSILGTFIVLPGITHGGCTCDAWCRGRGYPGGICGDGHTCICTGMDPRGCTCDAWCRGRGYQGGVCGDGHTCMCDGKRAKEIDRNPCKHSRRRCKNDVTNISTQNTHKLTQ